MKALQLLSYRCFILVLFFLSLPLAVIISVIITLLTGFPFIFRQRRIGYRGKPFVMYKFRTMVADAEKLREKLKHLNEAKEPAFKIHNDPRFTPVGRFLSHTGLDELPQLWNVIIGDMALLGPRPLPVAEAAKLTTWQKKRQMVKPGIISPWILEGYHARTFAAWMESDIRYAQNKSLWYDSLLFIKAGGLVLRLLAREIKGLVSL